MIVVHHLNESRSQRILWLLEELQVPYEVAFYQRDPRTNLAPVELREIHQLGKSPVSPKAIGSSPSPGRLSTTSSAGTATAASSPIPRQSSTTSTYSGCTTPRDRRPCRW
jgi:hypothetical protein